MAMTIQDVAAHYLLVARRELSHAFADEVERRLNQFVAEYGALKVSEAKTYHLVEFIENHPEWKSGWTQGSAIRMIKRAFNWAVEMEFIERNPFLRVKNRKGQRGQPMSDKHFHALYKACRLKCHRDVLTFLRLTGARPCELSSLKWPDVYPDRGVAVLSEHKTAKKTGRPRIILLVPEVLAVIEGIRQSRRPKPHPKFVFVNGVRNPWNKSSLGLLQGRLRKRAGVPDGVCLYGLRHGYGTRGAMNGIPLPTLAVLMGHSSCRMTEHYLHVADQTDHLVEAALMTLPKDMQHKGDAA